MTSSIEDKVRASFQSPEVEEKETYLEQIIDLTLAGKDASKTVSLLESLHSGKPKGHDYEGRNMRNIRSIQPR